MRFIHSFVLLPKEITMESGGTKFLVHPDAPLKVEQGVCMIASDTRDVPFEGAMKQSGPQWRYTWVGCVPMEQYLQSVGHRCGDGLTITAVAPVTPSIPVIDGPLAFLVSLDLAIEQFGTTMPDTLRADIHSFIAAEKERRGINAS